MTNCVAMNNTNIDIPENVQCHENIDIVSITSYETGEITDLDMSLDMRHECDENFHRT